MICNEYGEEVGIERATLQSEVCCQTHMPALCCRGHWLLAMVCLRFPACLLRRCVAVDLMR